jgi:SAM-dependent methyltransferase
MENHFGAAVAARYDDELGEWGDTAVVAETVEFLAALAGDGAALELGVGTGRIALPLAERGVRVHGIDLSEAMVDRLREKPGADAVAVTIGDFATTRIERTFSLAYVVFNTIMNLTTQDAQVACFESAAAHLEPGGRFVVEVGVPGLQRLAPGQTIQDFEMSEGSWGLDEYDVVEQRLTSHYFVFEDGGVRHSATPFRYAWPAELDLMARLAGMSLRERWGGWARQPFTSDSVKHVSVWQKPKASR